jgi:hypothetical protein
MAKTEGPLLSLKAHGSIADLITYQGGKNHNQVHIKKTPTDKKTTTQITNRAIVTTAAASYTKESEATKTLYDQEAIKKNIISGYNLYIKIFLKYYTDWQRFGGAKFNKAKFGGPNNYLDK